MAAAVQLAERSAIGQVVAAAERLAHPDAPCPAVQWLRAVECNHAHPRRLPEIRSDVHRRLGPVLQALNELARSLRSQEPVAERNCMRAHLSSKVRWEPVGSMRLLLTATTAIALAAAPALAAKPDLKVTRVSVGTGQAKVGDPIKVGDTTRNYGRTPSRASTTAYYLSFDGTKSADDFRIGNRRVKALKRRRTSRGSTNGRVPPG